ncbi:hypothetical protein BC835DRAFT_1414598 [Cytidiella melzeri]|nr:hypothetical protein BC835DRAFT_1414598 [Cytidiella melzeri]
MSTPAEMSANWTRSDKYHNSFLVKPDEGLEHALKSSTEDGLPNIAVSTAQGRYLYLIAKTLNAKRVLEVGTLGGKQSSHLANAYSSSTLFVVIFNNYVSFGPGVTTTVYIGLDGKEQPEYWRSCLENLRLLPLYDLNRRVLAFMECTFAVALVTSTSIMAFGLSKLNVISIPIHLPNISVSMCTVTNLDSVSF